MYFNRLDESYRQTYFKQLKSVVHKKKKFKANYPRWVGEEMGHFNVYGSAWRKDPLTIFEPFHFFYEKELIGGRVAVVDPVVACKLDRGSDN